MNSPAEFRPDFARTARLRRDNRSPERIRAHYELELGLSDRLRKAPPADRARVFGEVYGELFASLPDHTQHTAAKEPTSHRIGWQLRGLSNLLRPGMTFVEIGCGDAAVSMAVAERVGQAYGVDVTEALIDHTAAPANFGFVKTDGTHIPLPDASVDLVYSNQLMEHLVPEDAAAQITEIARILRTGGKYFCITPSKLTGPHDVSAFFDYEATGFHLREYDYRGLHKLFRAAGFTKTDCFVSAQGRRFPIPYPLIRMLEEIMRALPKGARSWLGAQKPVRWVMGIFVIATR